MAAGTNLGLEIVQAGHVNQAYGLAAPIGEGVSLHVFEMRGAARFVAKICGQEQAQLRASLRPQSIFGHFDPVWRPQCQRAGTRLEERRQLRDAGVAGQAHEIGFRQPHRIYRVEPRIALCERECSIPWNGAASLDRCFLQRFRCEAFDREAI